MSPAPDPHGFYTERIPAQWNRALAERERSAGADDRVLAGMRAVDATIRIDVEDAGAGSTYYLNIRAGRMTAGAAADQPPFLTLRQDGRAFQRLAREAGDSALALLGGIAGLAGEMHLTRARVESLRAVAGSVRFEVTGEKGFGLLTHFGTQPPPSAPDTCIAVDEATWLALRTGELNPQDAFLAGRMVVTGDMQMAMQLALAALAPDA